MIRGRPRAAAALTAVATALVACGTEPGGTTASSSPADGVVVTETEEVVPGATAEVRLGPATNAALNADTATVRAPLVVLVPGGGWATADRAGLGPLADTLAAGGAVVVTASYRAADAGVAWPVPVEDVGCAVAFGVERARTLGLRPSAVVVAGHSAGAHLAMLAALAPTLTPGPDCPWPAAEVDGVVGLAGPYDVAAVADQAVLLFGATPEEDPEAWAEGDPATHVGTAPPVSALLMHGDADALVPPAQTDRMASALRSAGHDTTVVLVPGADHDTIYQPEVAGPPVLAWLADQDWL